MFKKEKSKALSGDSYSTRLAREKQLAGSNDVYTNKYLGLILTFVFVIVDSFCCYSCWNAIQTQSPIMNILMTVACALTLDVPPMFCAYSLVAYKQGLISEKRAKIITIATLIVVGLVISFYFAFRIITKDIIFDGGTVGNIVNSADGTYESENSNNLTTLFPAIFSGILPLATSIASFVVTFLTVSPIKDKLFKLRKAKITAQSNIVDLKMALKEAENSMPYSDYLIAREDDLYTNFCDEISAQSNVLKQTARVIIMKKLANADSISEVADDGNIINAECEISKSIQSESKKHIQRYNDTEAVK